MTTPEGKVKERVKRVLREHGAYWHMPVQNGMGATSLDFVGCHRGRFFAIETKAANKRMTPRQDAVASDMRAAGGQVFLVNDVTGCDDLVAWLTNTHPADRP